jgi:signal transduction histidine kinase
VALAFNRMGESLRRTLSELSQREALAAVGSFASELAHEVRNPLTSIKVDLQFVEERLAEGSEEQAVQRAALDALARLDHTVTGVLQIARSGRISLEPLDLTEPVQSAVRAIAPIARTRSVTLDYADPPSPLEVVGDAHALQQLFVNVIRNAVQAVPAGGTVRVGGFSAENRVTVRVRDDGPGISPDQLQRVREPFFTTREDGTGLGLAVADRIAAAHRAELVIMSEQGQGTVVEVRFLKPALSSTAFAEPQETTPAAGPMPRGL